MLIVRSLDERLTVGMVRFFGSAHPPKLLDLGYLGTEKSMRTQSIVTTLSAYLCQDGLCTARQCLDIFQ